MNDTALKLLPILVEGPKACFRRTEFVADLVTYDVLTPLHATRLIEQLVGHEASGARPITCERIHILSPIRSKWCETSSLRGPRRTLALTDVRYVIEARVGSQAVLNGGIHFGPREFLGQARTIAPETIPAGPHAEDAIVDLGWLPVGVTSTPKRTVYRRLAMKGGVIDLTRQDDELVAC